VSLQARAEAEVLRQECHDLQDQLQRREAQLTVAHAAHDEALERLKAQSGALLRALGDGTRGSGGAAAAAAAGAADDMALAQVRATRGAGSAVFDGWS
jgi:hypothetical protein